MDQKVRLDKYLWAIRVFKTRTLATSAIDEGKVKHQGVNVKPSKSVAVGDVYDIKTPARKWTVEVTKVIQDRVAYEQAVLCYVDLTTEEDKLLTVRMTSGFYTGKRISKTGRPTKKQRRDLGSFLGEAPENEID